MAAIRPDATKRADVCRRKRRYSKSAAIRAISHLRDTKGRELVAYRCAVCGAVHLATARDDERKSA